MRPSKGQIPRPQPEAGKSGTAAGASRCPGTATHGIIATANCTPGAASRLPAAGGAGLPKFTPIKKLAIPAPPDAPPPMSPLPPAAVPLAATELVGQKQQQRAAAPDLCRIAPPTPITDPSRSSAVKPGAAPDDSDTASSCGSSNSPAKDDAAAAAAPPPPPPPAAVKADGDAISAVGAPGGEPAAPQVTSKAPPANGGAGSGVRDGDAQPLVPGGPVNMSTGQSAAPPLCLPQCLESLLRAAGLSDSEPKALQALASAIADACKADLIAKTAGTAAAAAAALQPRSSRRGAAAALLTALIALGAMGVFMAWVVWVLVDRGVIGPFALRGWGGGLCA